MWNINSIELIKIMGHSNVILVIMINTLTRRIKRVVQRIQLITENRQKIDLFWRLVPFSPKINNTVSNWMNDRRDTYRELSGDRQWI